MSKKSAIWLGVIAGFIGTRFLEDGNLLVTNVLVLISVGIALAIRKLAEFITK